MAFEILNHENIKLNLLKKHLFNELKIKNNNKLKITK